MIKIETERKKILERIDLLISFYKLSVEDITGILGYTNITSYYNARSKLTIVTYNTFTKLVGALPEINIDWLVTGRGSMVESSNKFKHSIAEEEASAYKSKVELIYETLLRIEQKMK